MTPEQLNAIREAWVDPDHVGTHWDGCVVSHPRCAVRVLLDEVDRLRAKNADLNRRCQEADAAVASLRACVEAVNGGRPWVGGSLGRAFLAYDNAKLKAERDRLAARVAELEGRQ